MKQENKTVEKSEIDILVVEDESHISRFLEFVLERAGYRVAILSQGENVVPFIEEAEPTAVVLDLVLPDISGEEILARLRRQGMRERLKIVVLTARASDAATIGLPPGSVDAFCSKPIAPSTLLSTLRSLNVEVRRALN